MMLVKPRPTNVQLMTPITPTPARPTTPGKWMALTVGKVAKQTLCLNLADDNIQQLID